MRLWPAILSCLIVAVPVAAQRQSVEIFGGWGAFHDRSEARCYAAATPSRSPRPDGWQPAFSITYWPQRRQVGQIHVRLSREKRPGSAILLRVDDRTFQLVGGGANAWAADARADAEIVRAIRTGVGLSIETRSVRGGRVRDFYLLRGAATAIDAAAIACAGRR